MQFYKVEMSHCLTSFKLSGLPIVKLFTNIFVCRLRSRRKWRRRSATRSCRWWCAASRTAPTRPDHRWPEVRPSSTRGWPSEGSRPPSASRTSSLCKPIISSRQNIYWTYKIDLHNFGFLFFSFCEPILGRLCCSTNYYYAFAFLLSS